MSQGRLTESADRVGTHVHWRSNDQAFDRQHRVSHQAAKIGLVPILKAWCPFAAMIARHLNHWESGKFSTQVRSDGRCAGGDRHVGCCQGAWPQVRRGEGLWGPF
jgi:hypothetical protein